MFDYHLKQKHNGAEDIYNRDDRMRYSANLQIDDYGVQKNYARTNFSLRKRFFKCFIQLIVFRLQK